MADIGVSICSPTVSAAHAPQIWVFDVDGCLVDALTGTSLRPGSAPLLQHLRHRGCTVLLWSAGGAAYAERRARETGIHHLFQGFFDKDQRDTDGRYRTDHLLGDAGAAVFVDDRPEDMPLGADVMAVAPYLAASDHDRGLAAVARRAGMG